MKKILKSLFGSTHNSLSRSYLLSRYYLLSLGAITRVLGDNYFTKRIINHLASVNWPDLVFPPRKVMVCKNASINIIPHVGEFDFRALFLKNLDYEDAIFAWLLPQMAQFDAVFEIGANVGVYSVFFSKYGRVKDQRVVTPVFCFEPSNLAYSRLLANIECNSAGSVIPFNSAVSEVSGFVTFFEPDGHLTNGSLDPQFAGQFAENVRSTTVSSLSGADVLELASEFDSILLKIDVEGAESIASLSLWNLLY